MNRINDIKIINKPIIPIKKESHKNKENVDFLDINIKPINNIQTSDKDLNSKILKNGHIRSKSNIELRSRKNRFIELSQISKLINKSPSKSILKKSKSKR